MQVTAKDMRFHAGTLLDSVSRGEEVTITFRGTPKAKLVPVSKAEKGAASEMFGMWEGRDDMGDPSDHVRTMRRGRF